MYQAMKVQSMKILAVGIWVFVNVTVLGLLVYIYLLWSVYWKTTAAPKPPILRTSIQKLPPLRPPWQGRLSTVIGYPRHYWNETLMRQKLALPLDKLQSKIATYKNQLIVKLRQSQLDASNLLLSKELNMYDVKYQGNKIGLNMQADHLVCSVMKSVKIQLLDESTEPFRRFGLGTLFPNDSSMHLMSNGFHNSCAIVSSAGSLHKSSLGQDIDSHEIVLRFNSAPTKDHESDVGSKTTIRIVNSQVISKPEFEFFTSPLYKNITLIAWDPSNYKVNLDDWFRHPDFDLFTPYFKHRQLFPNQRFYILHPKFVWSVWNFLQQNTAVPIVRHPPSSGLLGIIMMLHICHTVDVYEYIPSMRLTKRCHYFDVDENVGCTFGDWHPLASEKLLALAMSSATDIDIFGKGVLHFKGIPSLGNSGCN